MNSWPAFVREIVHTSACVKCNAIFDDRAIRGFGIRLIDGRYCMCVSTACRACSYPASLNVPTSRELRDYVVELARMLDIPVDDVPIRQIAPEALTNRHTTHHWLQTDGEAWTDPHRKSTRLVSALSPLGMKIKIASYLPGRKTGVFDVLGGYRSDGDVVILYRCAAENIVPSDQLALLRDRKTLTISGFDELSLTIPDWPVFGRLSEGSKFRLNGRAWTKLTTAQLRRRVAGLWTLAHREQRRRG